MAEKNHIWQRCPICKGTGEDPTHDYPSHEVTRPCENCKGTGEVYFGMLKINGPE